MTRFLTGMYHGGNYPLDLTDLRTLDADLANDCIDYFNYDRLGKVEVHTHLPGGGNEMNGLIEQQGIRRQVHWSHSDAPAARIQALGSRPDRDPADFRKEALSELLNRYESEAFGALLETQPSPDTDWPVLHAHTFDPGGGGAFMWGSRWPLERARV